MLKFSCIIIEDEPLAQEKMQSFINKIPFLHLLGTFDNALDGLSFLKSNEINLLFLDISLDDFSGIDLLETSKLDCQVIFTTAHQEYALKGYELNITDYLLKPFTFERFLQAVNKAFDKFDATITNTIPEFIFIKTENRLEKININDILFIEGMRDYRRIHTTTKKIMTLQNFSEIELLIPSNLVHRVHKSYMVNISKIDAIERNNIKMGTHLIPISETYKTAFFQLLHL